MAAGLSSVFGASMAFCIISRFVATDIVSKKTVPTEPVLSEQRCDDVQDGKNIKLLSDGTITVFTVCIDPGQPGYVVQNYFNAY